MVTNKDAFNMMEHKYALFGLFFAFHNRLQAVGDAFYDEITCKQFFLLACLNLFPDTPPTMNDMARVMGCSRQNVRQIVDSLNKKGFIGLQEDSSDRRRQLIIKTEKCEQFAEKYRQKETKFLELLFADISENEIDAAYKIISKIEDNLKKVKVLYGQNNCNLQFADRVY